MRYPTSISGAAVLLALAPSALALGTATLVNGCGYDVYYASVAASGGGMIALSPGGAYSEGYSDPGQGVSIKVSSNDSLSGPITQFEFTWADGKINYDISNINGNPFENNGMVLTPSMAGDSSNPTCEVLTCSAGEPECGDAYNQPDDVETRVCDQESNLVFTVCAGGSSKFKREPAARPDNVVRHSHRIHSRHLLRK